MSDSKQERPLILFDHNGNALMKLPSKKPTIGFGADLYDHNGRMITHRQ